MLERLLAIIFNLLLYLNLHEMDILSKLMR